MDLAEALDVVVARAGHHRFRELCDGAHPGYNPAVVAEVLRMAGGEPALPSLLTRAVNFAAAVVSHVAAGMPTLDDAAYEARLAVCSGCELRTPEGSCSHRSCGCVLADHALLSGKARWADQQCPLQKWPANPGSPAP